MSFFPMMRSLGQRIIDVFCPPTCLICGGDIIAGGVLCPSCFSSLRFIVQPSCRRCGEPFASADMASGDGVCSRCHSQPPLWHQARAALVYDSASRRLIFPLKYADRTFYAAPLAHLMGRAGEELLRGKPYVVPVPLHRRKLRQRRYNQAALLARAIGKQRGLDVVVDGLQRHRSTRPLAQLTVAERQTELRDAFSVRECRRMLFHGKRVLLIDDILTTGATAESCVRALLAVGCKRVDVLVAARACVGDDRPFFEGMMNAEN